MTHYISLRAHWGSWQSIDWLIDWMNDWFEQVISFKEHVSWQLICICLFYSSPPWSCWALPSQWDHLSTELTSVTSESGTENRDRVSRVLLDQDPLPGWLPSTRPGLDYRSGSGATESPKNGVIPPVLSGTTWAMHVNAPRRLRPRGTHQLDAEPKGGEEEEEEEEEPDGVTCGEKACQQCVCACVCACVSGSGCAGDGARASPRWILVSSPRVASWRSEFISRVSPNPTGQDRRGHLKGSSSSSSSSSSSPSSSPDGIWTHARAARARRDLSVPLALLTLKQHLLLLRVYFGLCGRAAAGGLGGLVGSGGSLWIRRTHEKSFVTMMWNTHGVQCVAEAPVCWR